MPNDLDWFFYSKAFEILSAILVANLLSNLISKKLEVKKFINYKKVN